MAAAKRKTQPATIPMATTTQRFIREHPICCFCGGTTPSETRDHVPAKSLFDSKHRPDELVFQSCLRCQQQSKKHEAVAAMLTRTFPDPATKARKKEVEKYMMGAFRAVPGLAEEMIPSDRQNKRFSELRGLEPEAAGVFNASGALLNESVQVFGVKLACALHYLSSGHIVLPDNAISIRWYSNVDRVENNLPDEVIKFLGEPRTLKQGTWSVPDQFYYQASEFDSAGRIVFFSAFRRSFAVLAMVWGSASNLPAAGQGLPTYSPDPVHGFRRIR
jgi:hypothetical protein